MEEKMMEVEQQVEEINEQAEEQTEEQLVMIEEENESWIKKFINDEAGIGVVEVILILVVLIGLVLIFKTQLTELIESIFETIVSDSSGI